MNTPKLLLQQGLPSVFTVTPSKQQSTLQPAGEVKSVVETALPAWMRLEAFGFAVPLLWYG